MGKNSIGEITVQLSDSKGKPRIRMVVDENDIPRMEFLDGDGKVTHIKFRLKCKFLSIIVPTHMQLKGHLDLYIE
ncbi:hypothetical protein [Gottfriedia acidiceleris]|uniref:hypothetical protein n=1 Tax=Gottfriedia acidiceleris TaxID=371036 RepID=UPI002FFE21FC